MYIEFRSRARLFSFLHASEAIAGLLGYPISSALMEYQLWAPFGIAVAVFMVSYVVLWFTPETSSYLTGQIDEAAILSEPNDTSEMEDNDTGHLTPTASNTVTNGSLKQWWDGLSPGIRTSSLWTFFRHRGLNIVFTCFIFKRISFASESFASQYASEILHKKLSATFWLRALGFLSQLLTFSLGIPVLTRTLESPGKEMWVVRGCLVDLIAGFLILWRGHSLLALCIGTLTLRLTAWLTCIRFGSLWPRGRIGSRAPVCWSVYCG